MESGRRTRPVTAGELRRRSALGSTATYRVVRDQGAHIVVEVVEAPGLEAGETVRLTRAAVVAMELLQPAGAPDALSAPDAQAGRAARKPAPGWS